MSASNIVALTAQTETELNASPFLVTNPAAWRGLSGDIIYGVNLPGKDARGGKYQRWVGDGVRRVWDANEVVNLAKAPTTAAVTDANCLSAVVKVNGTLLKHTAINAAPAAGAFRITAGVPGVATVTFTGVPADAGTVTINDGTHTATVFEFDTAGDGITSGRTKVDTSGATTAAAAAAAFVTAVNGVTTTLTVTAYNNGDGTVTLVSDTVGKITSLAVTESASNLTVEDFAGDKDTTVAIQFGTPPAADARIEVFFTAVADIQSITIPATLHKEAACPQIVRSDANAAVTVERLTR